MPHVLDHALEQLEAERLEARAGEPDTCPDCGASAEHHDDNGLPSTHRDYTRLCMSCGHQWSPNEG